MPASSGQENNLPATGPARRTEVAAPQNPGTLRRQAVSGAFWYGGSRAVIQLISWGVTIAVARVLLPNDYGLLGMALVYVGFVDFLNELGLGAAIIQLQVITAEDLDTIFWFGLSTSTVFYLLTLLLAPWMARFFHQPALTRLLCVTGISFLVSGSRVVPWNMLTRDVDFKHRSISESLGTLAGAITTLVLAYRGCGVWALALGFLMPNAVMTAQVYAQTGWRPRLRFSPASLRRCLTFSMNVAGARVAWYLEDNSDRFMVGKFLGDQALGFYGFAQRFGPEMSGRFLGMAMQVAFPVYARMQDDVERLAKSFLTSTELICAAIFPIPIGLFLVADDALPWLLTAKWLPMILPFKILCWAALLKTVHSVTGPAVLARGAAAVTFRFHVMSLCVLGSSYLIATRFGLVGVCWVWLTVYPILVSYWLARTRSIIGYQWRELGRALRPALIATAVMLGSVSLAQVWLLPRLHVSPPIRIALTVVIGASAYIAPLTLFFFDTLRRGREFVRPQSKLSDVHARENYIEPVHP